MFISRKRLNKLRQDAYEQGITKGYDLCWQMRQLTLSNQGFIIGGKLDQELEDILKRERR